MTLPTFPSLPGQEITVHKKPRWSTGVALAASGNETRARNYLTPLWDFEVSFSGLDMTMSGYYGGLSAASMQTLASFFLTCQGKYSTFLFVDPSDYLVTRQSLGTTDGTTTTYTLPRTLGPYTESAYYVTSISAVYLNGILQTTGWSLAAPNQLVFSPAPYPGRALTATYTFAYICRFSEDVHDYEEFYNLLSLCRSVKFQTVRSTGPSQILSGPRVIVLVSNTSFVIPVDWNSARNTIEGIGGGAGGGFTGGSGGGGGAYTILVNAAYSPGTVISCIVGQGGAGAASSGPGSDFGNPGTATNWNSGQLVADYGGSYIDSSFGGVDLRCTPTTGAQSGGNGGQFNIIFGGGGGGGGGAGGPNGPGAGGGWSASNQNNYGCGGGASNGGSHGVNAAYLYSVPEPAFDGSGTQGGTSRAGIPGGLGGTLTLPAGTAGSSGSGGGGGASGTGAGGAGSSDPVWSSAGQWWGPGSGGGGGGSDTAKDPGGAGGSGGLPGSGVNNQFGGGGGAGTPGGSGGSGAVIITYWPAV